MEFKIALRNLLKRPFLNSVKVIGLSLALSGTLIILLFLLNQLSYDRFHENADRIYRLTTTDKNNLIEKHFAKVFDPGFVPSMAAYFPEIESYVRLVPILGGVVKHEDQFIKVGQAFQSDSTFFNIFKPELLIGNASSILNLPGSMIVSESFATKIFGSDNPIGQIITLPEGQFYGTTTDFIVRGVMKDFPQNSHLHPQFITSPTDRTELDRVAWTYLLLRPNSKPENIEEGFNSFFAAHVSQDPALQRDAHLQRITDIHLRSNKLREIESNSSMSVVYTLAIAALLLMSIALINFFNLNIGMTVFTEKYLAIGKILGSSGQSVTKYFLFENILIGVTAIAVSLLAVEIADVVIIKNFGLHLIRENGTFILVSTTVFLLIIITSALFLSFRRGVLQMRLAEKNQVRPNRNVSISLIVLQNAISISLVVAVIVIFRQTNYVLKSSMGAESEELICFENVHSDVQAKFETFKSELLKNTSIKSVSAMLDRPGGEANDMMPFEMEGYDMGNTGKSDDNLIGVLPCDYSFAAIFNLSFLSGNNFSDKNDDHEGSGEYIINESAMKRLGYSNAQEIIGKEFGISFDPSIKIPKGKIIGVVNDFHLASMKRKIEPLVLFKRKNQWLLNFIVAFQPGAQKEGLSNLNRVWSQMFPGHSMQYEYVNHLYENVYETELLEARLLSLFTITALFISAMGLLGLSLLTTQRRMKEIAIRKINGADIPQLIAMLSWNFIKWIIVAFMIAIPFSYYAMNKWLEPFAYRTNVTWWIFALAGMAAVIIAFASVFVQSFKATNANPVDILRHE